MTISSIGSSLQALNRLEDRAQRIAQDIATAGTGAARTDRPDPGESLVSLHKVSDAFAANLKFVSTAHHLVGTLLDIKV
jgi:hypothetical protein